jgi:hypothetical protein
MLIWPDEVLTRGKFRLTKFSSWIFFTHRSSRYESPTFPCHATLLSVGTTWRGFLFMKANLLLSLKYLNECFELCEEGSGLRWKVRFLHHFPTTHGCNIFNAQMSGKMAGSKSHYWCLSLMKKDFLVHRIIFSIHNSVILGFNDEVDHIDTNKFNNKPSNLRLATSSKNSQNVNLSPRNTSGFKGVSYYSGRKSWIGEVSIQGLRYRTKGCPTPEKASELIREIRAQVHKEFTNHGNV